MSIIRCENVVKTYVTGDITVNALKGIDLEIEKGEMVAVMGPSGCGKTTLLNCLSGIDEVTSGRITIEDKDITTMDDNAKTGFRAKRMGFVFQFYNLLPVLSATENVELPLLIAGGNPQEARKRALELLDSVGLSKRASLRPNSLSGGERQRVTIARALSNTPAIVWADEPTGDLDVRTSEEVVALMRRLNKENGQTFVIVTHDPEVGAKCDRIIHMRDGQVVSTNGNVDHISSEIRQLG
ncbi:MAG: ABC transporter ATP-binding protein [Methanomassiliicoccus sp.]|nr:ABC transporter ATP-binding protein [Methanomassiliicoccus sp.]